MQNTLGYIRRGLILVLLSGLSCANAESIIYKWLDENGKTVYGQTPPDGIKATVFKPAVYKGDHEAAQKKLQQNVEGLETRRNERAEEQEAQDIDARNRAIIQENCNIARQNLELLQTRGKVNLKEGDGYRALPEEERQAKITEANKHIEEFCNQDS